MPNSDNTFGTHNKQTKIISQIDDGSTILTVFADVAAAKAFFFTDEALAVMDECCTIFEQKRCRKLYACGGMESTEMFYL